MMGTTVIRECRKILRLQQHSLNECNNAFIFLQMGCAGVVKSINKCNLKITRNDPDQTALSENN